MGPKSHDLSTADDSVGPWGLEEGGCHSQSRLVWGKKHVFLRVPKVSKIRVHDAGCLIGYPREKTSNSFGQPLRDDR